MSFTLRDYQADGKERTRQAFHAARGVIAVAPCGAGKTVLSSSIMEDAAAKGNRTWFLVHREELIDQTARTLDRGGVRYGVVKAGDGRVDSRALIQICSVQTLLRRLDQVNTEPAFIISDECHHDASAGRTKILTTFPHAKLLGLTATPYRLDGKGLGACGYEQAVEITTVTDLTERGYLVPARVLVAQKVDMSGVHRRGGDYAIGEAAARVNTAKLRADAIDAWHAHARNLRTIVFCVDIRHMQEVCEAYRRAGVKAECVWGDMDAAKRPAVIEAFARGEFTVLLNVGVATEGYDAPFIECVQCLRPTQSRNLFVQMVGRGLRICEGKGFCVVLDHAGLTEEHGFITDPISYSLDGGVDAQKARPTRKCKVCGAKYAGLPPYCPMCGASLTDMAGRTDEPLGLGDRGYQMVEAKRREKPDRAAQQADSLKWIFLNDLKQARARGYKPGWAVGRYKSRVKGARVSDEAMELARRRGLGIELRQGDGKPEWQWAE